MASSTVSKIPQAHKLAVMSLYWRLLKNSASATRGPVGFIYMAQRYRAEFERWKNTDLEDGKRLLEQGEEHYAATIWQPYIRPNAPGSTLYARNPPQLTYRIRYILNYDREGYEPVIGPSYQGPVEPGDFKVYDQEEIWEMERARWKKEQLEKGKSPGEVEAILAQSRKDGQAMLGEDPNGKNQISWLDKKWNLDWGPYWQDGPDGTVAGGKMVLPENKSWWK
ncbi:unnamed protein product [Pedinophyceae sp. YPF-701]|nr:unnamed protein product [Pedinophyceae sp. YPF-701]